MDRCLYLVAHRCCVALSLLRAQERLLFLQVQKLIVYLFGPVGDKEGNPGLAKIGLRLDSH